MKQMTDSKKEKRTDGVYREIFSMMFYLIFVVAATLLIIRFVGTADRGQWPFHGGYAG